MSVFFRKLSRDVPAMLGLAIVIVVLVLAVFGPLLAPHPQDVSASHLLRLASLGRRTRLEATRRLPTA